MQDQENDHFLERYFETLNTSRRIMSNILTSVQAQDRTLRMLILDRARRPAPRSSPHRQNASHSSGGGESFPQRMSRSQRVRMANMNLNPRNDASRNTSRRFAGVTPGGRYPFQSPPVMTPQQGPVSLNLPFPLSNMNLTGSTTRGTDNNTTTFTQTLSELLAAAATDSLSPVVVRPSQAQIDNATEEVSFSSINNPLNSTCPISHDPFSDNDAVLQVIPCGHIFTPDSLRQWFRTSVRCPLCRYDIRNYNPLHAVRNPYAAPEVVASANTTHTFDTVSPDPSANMNRIANFITADIMSQMSNQTFDNSGNITFEYAFLTPQASIAGISGSLSLQDVSGGAPSPNSASDNASD
jgi:hypothetical protein